MFKNIFKKRLSKEKIISDLKLQATDPGRVEEAKQNPDGWVYAIYGEYSPEQDVPPQAIAGAWKVDSLGNLTDKFQENPNFDPNK